MSPLNRRLKDLDDYLSPTDIVLRQLREMARLRSMTEYLASLKDGPTSDWPLKRMIRQAQRAVEKSMKGMPSDAIGERVREAVRDVLFLWHLYLKLNDRIKVGLRVAQPTIAWLYSEYRHILLYRQLSDASRDFPFPLDPQTAPAVDAALANQVQSWASLGDASTIVDWPYEVNQPDKVGDEDFDESRARAYRKVERGLRRLVRSKDIAAGKLVSLPAVPIPFLRNAPLIEGRWGDATVLELAEFGIILQDRGWTPRGSDDSHPLAFDEFTRADAEGEFSSIDDAAWHDARHAATDRVRAYPGRRRAFHGRDYVNLAPYQKWRARTVGARLDASTENGFVVPSGNNWVKNRGPNAVLSGCWVGPINSVVDPDMWFVHDSHTARRLQTARIKLFAKLRSSALDRKISTEEEAVSRWRRLAEDAIALIEGLAAAVERIRDTHFRGNEIVQTEYAQCLHAYRTALRLNLRLFDSEWEHGDPVQAYFDDRHRPQDRQTAYSPRERDSIERIEERIVLFAERMAHAILREAQYEALKSVGDRAAANRLLDQVLDEYRSERKDCGR